MKNILLPTDLSVQSLWPIHNIVKDAGNQKVTIHVVHMLTLPTSITELLTLNKPYDEVPATFFEALQLLRNKYKEAIEKVEFQLLYCDTSRYLNHFVEGNRIDAVYLLANYEYAQPLSKSAKCMVYFNRCKVPVHKLPLHAEAFSEYQILSALLNQGGQNEIVPSPTAVKPEVSYS